MVFSGEPEVSNTLIFLKNEDKPHFNWTSSFVPPKVTMLQNYHLYRALPVVAPAVVSKNVLAANA